MKLILIILLIPVIAFSQKLERSKVTPVGWFHNINQQINGVSFGLYSSYTDRNTITNGVRIEALGLGILTFFAMEGIDLDKKEVEPIMQKFSERINGVSFSTFGTVGYVDIYGLGINGVGCNVNQSHGIFISGLSTSSVKGNGMFVSGIANYIESFKGVSISGMFNESYTGSGLQVCLFSNKSKVFNGVQFSLYNKTTEGKLIQFGLINYIKGNPMWCRVLPIVNMRFNK